MNRINHKKVRKSILEIQRDWENGNIKELENLMTAWAGINALAPSEFDSFFVVDGFYGESLREIDLISNQWWSDWWRHCNLLFPSQYSMYLVCLENALQSIPGCKNVMLPHWNESDKYQFANGFPSFLTNDTFTYADGTIIKNPLVSFTFPIKIIDSELFNQVNENELYIKNLVYNTLGHAYTGLIGNPEDQNQVLLRNTQWPTLIKRNELLHQNIVNWLNLSVAASTLNEVNTTKTTTFPICDYQTYKDYLNESTYTVSSNSTSSQAGTVSVVPLEQPKNDIYSAIEMTLQKLDNKILVLNQLLDIMEMWAKTKHLV